MPCFVYPLAIQITRESDSGGTYSIWDRAAHRDEASAELLVAQ